MGVRWGGRGFCVALLGTLALLPGGATACGCGEEPGWVVAHGTSPQGVPWRIKASHPERTGPGPRFISVNFSYGPRDSYEGFGHHISVPMPLPKRFMLTASGGGLELGAEPEGNVDGLARRRVAEVVVRMAGGETMTVRPMAAPKRLRQRLPWLRGVRFYEAFFPADLEPREVTAFDAAGREVAALERRRGFFARVPRPH